MGNQNEDCQGSFDKSNSFNHDNLTAKHCYFRCLRPPENLKAIASVVYLVKYSKDF